MSGDPVVEEVRKRRRKLLQEKYKNSIGRLVSAGRKWEQEHPNKTVDLRKEKDKSQTAF